MNAHLKKTLLHNSDLQRANFRHTHLEGADISGSNLEGARLEGTYLAGAICKFIAIDGNTLINECSFDRDTDFTGVGLDAARIAPRLRTTFKNNIRRKQWQGWYKEGSWWKKFFLNPCVWCFWNMTDYGSSTLRIISTFLFLSTLFGSIYFSFEIFPVLHSIVHGLHPENVDMSIEHIFARSMYFSIVTMTTGFGDMYAIKTGNIWGVLSYCFISAQVIIGYVLLGALITRLGILFTDYGPAINPKNSAYFDGYKVLSNAEIPRVKIIRNPTEEKKRSTLGKYESATFG
ncbi:MAG: pentapeptide repeat-containing protein [Syntrophales bacterium]|nr:pentapeptide repeat-containing protein [Syntrophales bacterium]